MLIPYSLPFEKKDCSRTGRTWDDPVRALYPHHAELWPAEMPEHHQLMALHLRLARKRRRLKVLKFIKWCLGGPSRRRLEPARPATAANDGCATARPPAHPPETETIVSFYNPLKRPPAAPETCTRPDNVTPPKSAVGCHRDCR